MEDIRALLFFTADSPGRAFGCGPRNVRWLPENFRLFCRAARIYDFRKAAVYAVAGGVRPWVGFIHGAKLGFGESPQVARGYLRLALICWLMARRGRASV